MARPVPPPGRGDADRSGISACSRAASWPTRVQGGARAEVACFGGGGGGLLAAAVVLDGEQAERIAFQDAADLYTVALERRRGWAGRGRRVARSATPAARGTGRSSLGGFNRSASALRSAARVKGSGASPHMRSGFLLAHPATRSAIAASWPTLDRVRPGDARMAESRAPSSTRGRRWWYSSVGRQSNITYDILDLSDDRGVVIARVEDVLDQPPSRRVERRSRVGDGATTMPGVIVANTWMHALKPVLAPQTYGNDDRRA